MRVTEVRVRDLPEDFVRDSVDVGRGGRRFLWNARLVFDRTMKAHAVKFVYEKVVAVKPVVRRYSRSRCFACGRPTMR